MDTDLVEVKKLNAIRVLELMGLEGKSKVAACEEAGISVSTFDRIVAENKEMVREFVTIQYSMLHSRYGGLTQAHQNIIDAIMLKATPEILEKMELAKLLKLEPELRNLVGILEAQLGLIGGPAQQEEAAEAIVKQTIVNPPQLRPGRTRIVQHERTTEITFDNGDQPPSEEGSEGPLVVDGTSSDPAT